MPAELQRDTPPKPARTKVIDWVPSRFRQLPRHRGWLVILFAIALAAVPAIRLLLVGLTNGVNVISGFDFFATSHIPVIDAVLRGKYHWSHFLSDTMGFGTHQLAVEYLIRIALAKFFYWPIAGEVWIAWTATVVRTLAIAAILSHGLRPRLGAARWLILPLMAFLTFGGSQVGIVTAPTIGLNFGLPIAGFFVGLWAVVCIKNQRTALIAAVLAALFATFAGAYGLIAWPILGIGLLIYGFPRKSIYIWAGVATSSTIIYMLNVNPGDHPEGATHGFTPFALKFWLKAIGTPMGAGSPTTFFSAYALTIGIFGAIAGILGVAALVLRRPRIAYRDSFPAIAIIGFAAGCIWMIGDFRGDPHSWYEPVFMIWWQGLLAVIWTICFRYGLSSEQVDELEPAPRASISWSSIASHASFGASVGAIAVFWVMSMLYVNSNVDWRQKEKYLQLRSPAIASCEREWRTSLASSFSDCAGNLPPTGKVPASVRAQQLERHHIGVFAPSETRYLQGDWMLPLVSVVARARQQGRPQWVDDSRHMIATEYVYADPVLESLAMPQHSKVLWKVRIPTHVSDARFQTTVHLSHPPELPFSVEYNHGHLRDSVQSRIDIVVSRLDGTRERRRAFSIQANHDQSIDVDVSSFAGEYVLITIDASDAAPHVDAVLAKPIVKFHTGVAHISPTEDHLPIDAPTGDDLDVPVNPGNWTARDAVGTVVGDSTVWSLKSTTGSITATHMHACIADYQGMLISFNYQNVNHDATDLGFQIGFLDKKGKWTYIRTPARATNDLQRLYVPVRSGGLAPPMILEQIYLGLRGPTKQLPVNGERISYIEQPFSGIQIHSITLSAPYGTGRCEDHSK